MARSESNPIVGKTNYTDLNLTQYPDAVDTRANNTNMAGYENLKDYALAEHINALEDAVMAIQRALGIRPFVNKDGVNKGTISQRVTDLENKDYDPRYGGSGWLLSQTLVGHTHTGETGHPAQINLGTEVQGILSKTRINLDNANGGLTGADIKMSNADSRKIVDAVNDKLSVTQGGTIQKGLEILGGFQSRLYREWDANDRAAGTLITDYGTLTNQAVRGSGTAECRFIHDEVNNLLYGKFVLAVRARVSSKVTEEVLHLRMYDWKSGNWVLQNYLYLKGTDFAAANQWQTFYLTFNHDGDIATKNTNIHIWKPATTASLSVDFDCAYIMPTHPAVYDK